MRRESLSHRERGLRVAREASPHTSDALVAAIVKELTPPPEESGIIPDVV